MLKGESRALVGDAGRQRGRTRDVSTSLPQDHAQFLDVDPRLALQILGQHLALEVDLLQPVLQVHDTLKGRESYFSAVLLNWRSLRTDVHCIQLQLEAHLKVCIYKNKY